MVKGVAYLLMMLSKNLRSILYYIIGVTGVCLVIEVSKRTPGHMYGGEDLYDVKTAKPGSLQTTPKYRPVEFKSDGSQEDDERNDEDYDELIPKRNRGRGGGERDGGTVRVKGGGRGMNGKGREKWQTERGKGKEDTLPKVGKNRSGKWKQSDYNEEERGGKRVRGNKSRLGQQLDLEDNEKNGRTWDRKNKRRNNKLEKESSEDTDETTISNDEVEESDDTNDDSDNRDTEDDTNDTKHDVDNKMGTKDEDNVNDDDDNQDDNDNEKADDANDEDDNAKSDDDDTEDDENEDVLTEYSPADPEHSCSSFSLTDEFVARKKQVDAACQKINEEEGAQRRMYSRVRWAIPQRLLYCPVFKAASTTWLMNYMRLKNHSTETHKSGNLHIKITELFPAPTVFKLRKKIFEESLKFMVVRHPFERVVSAYRDKLAGFSRNPHYLDMRKIIIQRYRKKNKENSNIPTFHETVDFLLEELEKLESGKEKIYIDGHFMPYSRRCLPCAMDYDFIIKFETLEEDSNYIIKQCHLENLLKVTHENNAPTGPRTEQGYKNKSKKVKQGKAKPKEEDKTFVSLDFFKEVPVNKIKQLYRYYRQDFEIFGYSAEEYFDQS